MEDIFLQRTFEILNVFNHFEFDFINKCLEKIYKSKRLSVNFNFSDFNYKSTGELKYVFDTLCNGGFSLTDEKGKSNHFIKKSKFDSSSETIEIEFSKSFINIDLYNIDVFQNYLNVNNCNYCDKELMKDWILKYYEEGNYFKISFNDLWKDIFIKKDTETLNLKKYEILRSINHLNSLPITIKFKIETPLKNLEKESIKIQVSANKKNLFGMDREQVIDQLVSTLDEDTSTVLLMDIFEHKEYITKKQFNIYSQLVIKDFYRLEIKDQLIRYRIVIEKIKYKPNNMPSLTISEIKVSGYEIGVYIGYQITIDIMNQFINTDKIYYLDKPIHIRAQNSSNRDYGRYYYGRDLYYETLYGETSNYLVVGIYIYD